MGCLGEEENLGIEQCNFEGYGRNYGLLTGIDRGGSWREIKKWGKWNIKKQLYISIELV